VLGEQLVSVPLNPPRIPRRLQWDRTRASTVRSNFVVFLLFRLYLPALELLAVFTTFNKLIEFN
jgi:hypothetical protein